MPRVLICDKLEPSGLDLLKQGGLEVDNRPGLKGDDLQAALRAADGCIVRSGTRITAELLAEPGKLRAIARAGVGVDNIDVAAATRRGIVVMNTPSGNTVTTAEHAIALLTALARHLPAADASMKAGKWEQQQIHGHATGRQDARDHRRRPHWPRSCSPGRRHEHARAGPRSVPDAGTGRGDRRRKSGPTWMRCCRAAIS